MRITCVSLFFCVFGFVFTTNAPAQQRFLKVLGQRPSNELSASLSPTINPFHAAIPTNATVIVAVVDADGNILTDENCLYVSLRLALPDDEQAQFKRTVFPSEGVRVQNGIIAFAGIRLDGTATSALPLLFVPSDSTVQSTSTIVELRGGKPSITMVRLSGQDIHNAALRKNISSTVLGGTIPSIQVGKPARMLFPNGMTDIIAVAVRDRFGNIPSFSTTVTIGLLGGNPILTGESLFFLNNRTTSDQITGMAYFTNFQVWGTTTNNASLIVSIPSNGDVTGAPNTQSASTTVNLIASDLAGIAPVLIPDPKNLSQFVRIPTKMFIGKTAPKFYAQAVDQFGNRISGDPSDPNGGYNGGTATISFPAPGVPILNPASTPASGITIGTVTNSKQFSASGVTATSVRGLFTFDKFVPLAPSSDAPLDVVMSIADPQLPGVPQPLGTGVFPPLFPPIPPVTTANTTFYVTPKISITAQAGNNALANGSMLALRERRGTFRTLDSVSSGNLTIRRPAGSAAFPAIIGYTLEYTDSVGKPLPNVGATTTNLPAPLGLGAVPFGMLPPLPAPTPVAINGLQGDLSPQTIVVGSLIPVNIGTNSAPNSITLSPDTLSQAITFTARWSDQSFPRNPGLQGRRTVTLRLLPEGVGTTYDIDATASTATVTLDDPTPVAPIILNTIQNQEGVCIDVGVNELETPGFRSDGQPNTAFYDDNFNPLTYSVTSSNPTFIAKINQNDDRFAGRPSIVYTFAPNASAGSFSDYTVRANDGFGGTATLTFRLTLRSSQCGMTDVADAGLNAIFTVSPNPTNERLTLQVRATTSGEGIFRLVNMLGEEVFRREQSVNATELLRQEIDMTRFPAGIYVAEWRNGATRTARNIVKY